MKKNNKKLCKDNKKICIAFICLIIAISLFSLIFFRIDPDYLWHFKAGEYMINHGILRRDVFSWYTMNKYWMSHEWLFEIIIYGLKVIFSNYHVLIYSFLSIFLLLFILFFCNKKNYLKNIPFTLMWFLIFIILLFGYMQARPHLISFSFLAITIYVLYDLYKNSDSKKIYILPFLSILWANFHGGSSNLPYLLCLLFIIGGLFSFEFDKIVFKKLSRKQIIKYFSVMILCMLTVCINIHGFKMFTYPYLNMLDSVMINNIGEWKSTNLHEIYHYIYFIILIIIIFTMLLSKKKIEFMDLLLLAFSTYLGLKSIRFWMYLYIVMSFVIFEYVNARKEDKSTISCIFLFTALLFCLFIKEFTKVINIDYKYMLDDKIINLIKKENPERLYNMYDYGGELIYNDILVFIDGRADLYSKYNYSDYLKISKLEGDYIKIIEKYDFDYFLVDEKYPISTYLKYNFDYELLYKNDGVAFYRKIIK